MMTNKTKEIIGRFQQPDEDPIDTLIRILQSGEATLGDLADNIGLSHDQYSLRHLRWLLGRKLLTKIETSLFEKSFIDLLSERRIDISVKLQGVLEDRYCTRGYEKPLTTLRDVVTIDEVVFLRRHQAGPTTLSELQVVLKKIHPTLDLGMVLE